MQRNKLSSETLCKQYSLALSHYSSIAKSGVCIQWQFTTSYFRILFNWSRPRLYASPMQCSSWFTLSFHFKAPFQFSTCLYCFLYFYNSYLFIPTLSCPFLLKCPIFHVTMCILISISNQSLYHFSYSSYSLTCFYLLI